MNSPTSTIVIWNAEWRTRGPLRDQIEEHLWKHDPDIVCLTEAHDDFPGSGNTICSDRDYGYPLIARRRKVVLWSRFPWRNVDPLGSAAMPSGRYVSGTTDTPVGPLSVYGGCIPWPQAHVSSGRRDRKLWEDHTAYLRGLEPLLSSLSQSAVFLGDFNQHIPRKSARRDAFDTLEEVVLRRFTVPTAGQLGPDRVTLIDHLAHTRDFRAVDVEVLSNQNARSARLSDHLGVKVEIERIEPVR